jgi:hypothetical protein
MYFKAQRLLYAPPALILRNTPAYIYNDFLCGTSGYHGSGSWVVTPCSSERAQRVGGTHHLHLQGRRVSQARYQPKQGSKVESLVSCWCYSLTINIEATCYTETSGSLRTTQHYNPGHRTHQCICVFRMVFTINSDYFPKQH